MYDFNTVGILYLFAHNNVNFHNFGIINQSKIFIKNVYLQNICCKLLLM